MQTSQSITKIASAFLKAQAEMGAAKKGESNPFFRSKYADLSSVLEACKNCLNDNGISILQPHVTDINTINGELVHYVETVLVHESGEFFSSRTKIEVSKKNDPQALGSAITYARRYGLMSMVSLPAEDDDGEGAMGRFSKTENKPKIETKPEQEPEQRRKFVRTPKEKTNESVDQSDDF